MKKAVTGICVITFVLWYLHSPPVVTAAPDLGTLQYVVNSGPKETYLDVVFVAGKNIDQSVIASQTQHYANVLLNFAPVNLYRSRINIAYTSIPLDETFFGCYYLPYGGYGNGFYNCDATKIDIYYRQIGADYVIVMFDANGPSTGGPTFLLRKGAADGEFMHEFGHTLPNLADEYVLYQPTAPLCGEAIAAACYEEYLRDIPAKPNIDVVGCPKWCSSSDLSLLISENQTCSIYATQEECGAHSSTCTWFHSPHPFLGSHCVLQKSEVNIGTQCAQGTGCYYGADTGQLAFRSSQNSIMNDAYTDTIFNTVAQGQFEQLFSCCYPRQNTTTCQTRRDEIYENVAQRYYGIRQFYKIARCGLDDRDVNEDMLVDVNDISSVLVNYTLPSKVGSHEGELTQDKKVNAMDVAIWMTSQPIPLPPY